MKREELLKVNKLIDRFYDDYSNCFENITADFSVEDYIEYFVEDYYPLRPIQYKLHYVFDPSVIEKYKDTLVGVYQPSDSKNGFLAMVSQISRRFHVLMQVGIEYREKDLSNIQISPIFISFDGMKPILDWKNENKEHLQTLAYADPEDAFGFVK